MPEFEEIGPDYVMQNDFYPKTNQAVFKDALSMNMVTPDRKHQSDLFSGVLYRPVCKDKDPICVPLYSFNYEIVNSADANWPSYDEKNELYSHIHKAKAVLQKEDQAIPYVVKKIDIGKKKPLFSPCNSRTSVFNTSGC